MAFWKIIYFICLIYISFGQELSDMPTSCKLTQVKMIADMNQNENSFWNMRAIKCDVNKFFKFDFNKKSLFHKINPNCSINSNFNLCESDNNLHLEWPKNELIILDKNFNISQMINFVRLFKYSMEIYFNNLNGIDINLMDDNNSLTIETKRVFRADLYNCQLDFYIDKKLIKSCSDILMSGKSVVSIFQIERFFRMLVLAFIKYKTTLCPLVFNNTKLNHININSLANTFYKTNVMKFSKETLEYIDVRIDRLQMHYIEYIDLDIEFLNPYVFKETSEIIVTGSVNIISNDLFVRLSNLRFIMLEIVYFRKLIHKNGIEWIKGINKNLTAEITKADQMLKFKKYIKIIALSSQINSYETELFSKAFPDEDFCFYKDFPFKQLVIIIENNLMVTEYSCTYLWLIHHFLFIKEFYSKLNITNSSRFTTYYDAFFVNIIVTMKPVSNESMSRCDFDKRLDLCNKTNYQIKDIWSTFDTQMLNKKLQISFKISSYFVSLLGIFTNLIVIVVILNKKNTDLFKGFKQYSYLCLNSFFGLFILVINILSWTTECFYPFEVFCPEIRTFYFFQYFKIIFKSIFVPSFNFMCNFTYIAFAFNRVNSIDNDVKFLTKVGIKKYIALTFLFSLSLSAMKFFKYTVNNGTPYVNYPMSNEWDILSTYMIHKTLLFDIFFIINSISDIVNYVVFVLICLFVDIYMVVKLHKILVDKMKKLENLYKNDILAVKKKENEDVLKKAIQMVIINNAISFFQKAPSAFLPIINAYAQIYYGHLHNILKATNFTLFYSSLFYTGFFGQFIELCDLLYYISITIQFFIYKRFDKKIQIAIERLFKSNKKELSSKKI